VAALADLDHDGDLDVVLGGRGVRLLRNNGDGTFADITAESALAADGAVSALVPSDFDNRRDMDLLVARRDGPPLLFQNRRDGTFADVAAGMRLLRRPAPAAAAGDINKMATPDLFLGGLQLSDGRGGFAEATLPVDVSGARSVALVDVDMDGLLDIVAAGERGLVVLRNVGTGWTDLTQAAAARALGALSEVLAFDADGDGDEDLAVAGSDGSLRLLVNDGGNRNRSLRVRLTGLASNKSGVGAKLELRAGSLRQKLESYATTPPVAAADMLFGLGGRAGADALRVLWPSGILQTEMQPGADLAVTELDRKPSSCPYLYAWSGSRFEFVSDFLGGGEMGYWLAPGVRNEPDPVEYVRIAPGRLQPKDGRLELRVTNELEEVLYLDRLELLAVTHPEDVEVHPAEGMTHAPRPFRLFAARDLRTPRAIDDAGRDWSDAVARIDRRFAEGFALAPVRGYAESHTLTLDLSGIPASHTLLLLTGWTDYAFSSDNVAANQRALAMEPPVLEARGGDGVWRTALADVGIPVGRPQTIVWDLSGVPGPERTLRLRTNMRIYWDRIAVALPAKLALETMRLPRASAQLAERGFSAGGPFEYDYARAGAASPWKLMPGRYTRAGDVSELIDQADDLFVVARPGDALAVAYDARTLPTLPKGWTRTFLLKGDGFSKEMDLHSASPDVAAPLPFHGMTAYPPSNARPVSVTQARYNTRVIQKTLPPLELAECKVRATPLLRRLLPDRPAESARPRGHGAEHRPHRRDDRPGRGGRRAVPAGAAGRVSRSSRTRRRSTRRSTSCVGTWPCRYRTSTPSACTRRPASTTSTSRAGRCSRRTRAGRAWCSTRPA
jgi:hypothetical protein